MTYSEIAAEVAALVEKKQKAYGDSFSKSGAILRVLYPNGLSPEDFDDALTIIRIIDKLFRIATDRDAFGEDPWRDVMGYALLAARRNTTTDRERQEFMNWCLECHGEFADGSIHRCCP